MSKYIVTVNEEDEEHFLGALEDMQIIYPDEDAPDCPLTWEKVE